MPSSWTLQSDLPGPGFKPANLRLQTRFLNHQTNALFKPSLAYISSGFNFTPVFQYHAHHSAKQYKWNIRPLRSFPMCSQNEESRSSSSGSQKAFPYVCDMISYSFHHSYFNPIVAVFLLCVLFGIKPTSCSWDLKGKRPRTCWRHLKSGVLYTLLSSIRNRILQCLNLRHTVASCFGIITRSVNTVPIRRWFLTGGSGYSPGCTLNSVTSL